MPTSCAAVAWRGARRIWGPWKRRHGASVNTSRRSSPAYCKSRAYTRALLDLPGSARSKGATDANCDAIIAARARRQAIITEPGHRFQFVIGEIALWSAPDGTEAQRKQLEHLIATIDLPNVELGVIPLRSPMPVAPLSGFRLLDIEAFEVLRAAATTGRGAVALIRSVASEMA